MGMQVGHKGGRRYQPLAEINVTPFVDVMLVLLIVFMVTAPLLATGVPVTLPKENAANLGDDTKPLEISITEDGTLYIQETVVTFDAFIPRLTAIAQNDLDKKIYLFADTALDYGQVVRVMAAIQQAGFTKVNLRTQAPGRAG